MNWKQILKTLPVVALGNLVMAAGIVLFILPSGLITGGTTGLGIIAQHLTGMPIAVFQAIFNVAMFLLVDEDENPIAIYDDPNGGDIWTDP